MSLKRSAVLALNTEHWFEPEPERLPDFKVCLVPAATSRIINTSEVNARARLVCREAFVNFQGYDEDDGNGGSRPVPNSLEARQEIYSVVRLATAIDNELVRLNDEIALGEGNGASD